MSKPKLERKRMRREPDRDPNNPVLAARFMVERATFTEAAADARYLCAFAERFGTVEQLLIERYWKVPEWFEVALHLRAASGGRSAAFTALVEALTPECFAVEDPHTPWAVWDARSDPPLAAESMAAVRWFNVE